MSYTQEQIEKTAESISSWAFSDSHVRMDKIVLIEEIKCDFETAGRLPTEEECEILVTGGDEGGVPEELEELFPRVHAFIASHWE